MRGGGEVGGGERGGGGGEGGEERWGGGKGGERRGDEKEDGVGRFLEVWGDILRCGEVC